MAILLWKFRASRGGWNYHLKKIVPSAGQEHNEQFTTRPENRASSNCSGFYVVS